MMPALFDEHVDTAERSFRGGRTFGSLMQSAF
jgi:hypothetical protein